MSRKGMMRMNRRLTDLERVADEMAWMIAKMRYVAAMTAPEVVPRFNELICSKELRARVDQAERNHL